MKARSERCCPLCRSPRVFEAYVLKERKILGCRECGAEHADPIPEKEDLDRIYCTGDYAARGYFKDEIHPDMKRAAEAVFAHVSSGRWLDLGSGKGEVLRLAKERGFEVSGVEVIEPLCRELTERYGVKMHCGYFEAIDLPEAYFDVVSAIDFIEHLPDPNALLSTIKRVLKPGGLLYLSTVDLHNVVNGTGSLSYRLTGGALRYAVEKLYPMEHLVYFTRPSLQRLVKSHGFEPLMLRGRHYALDRAPLSLPEHLFFRLAYAIHAVTGQNMNIDLLVRSAP